jgi:hypothetical protein
MTCFGCCAFFKKYQFLERYTALYTALCTALYTALCTALYTGLCTALCTALYTALSYANGDAVPHKSYVKIIILRISY